MGQPEDRVIADMTQYLQDFVEVPHPAFNQLPVCPFARKARLGEAIMFRVCVFNQDGLIPNSELMHMVTAFTQDENSEILIVIHPEINALSVSEMETLEEALNLTLAPLDLMGFGGHPQDTFNIQGTYTRRSSYPNLSIQSVPYLEKAKGSLQQTGYYRNWTPANLEAVGFLK